MLVAMMEIGRVLMLVLERVVTMWVRVWLAHGILRCMRMPVVFVMHVQMLVHHQNVPVTMGVALAQHHDHAHNHAEHRRCVEPA